MPRRVGGGGRDAGGSGGGGRDALGDRRDAGLGGRRPGCGRDPRTRPRRVRDADAIITVRYGLDQFRASRWTASIGLVHNHKRLVSTRVPNSPHGGDDVDGVAPPATPG